MLDTIFIATVGKSASVVTETLWKLMKLENVTESLSSLEKSHAKDQTEPIYPKKIYLIGTKTISTQKDNIKRKILELYKLAPVTNRISSDNIFIKTVKDSQSRDIKDIRSEIENVAYADHISKLLYELTESDPHCLTRIHMSLAGGRKPMSSYAQTAMMYFGRLNDQLSHTLIDPASLEGCPDFWWPGQAEPTVKNRDGVSFSTDTEAASVDLVPVPFVRLSIRLPKGTEPESKLPELLNHRMLTEWVQAAIGADELVIDLDTSIISYGGDTIKLAGVPMALYATMAVAQVEHWQGAGPDGLGGNHVGWLHAPNFLDPDTASSKAYVAIFDKLRRDGDDGQDSTAFSMAQGPLEGELEFERKDRVKKALRPVVSNIAKQLKSRVDNLLLLQALIPARGEKSEERYGLPMPAHRIVLKGFGRDERGLGPRRQILER